MKLKIKKRDIIFYILGMISILLIDIIFDWENNVKTFKEGYNAATHDIEYISE